MVWRPSKLTREQMEERRLAAARLLRSKRLSQADIARELGVSRASITRWQQALARGGIRHLRRRRVPGRASRLTPVQWRQLFRTLQRGACRAGFETERWTEPRIAQVIWRQFGVRYHPRSLGRALRARGWTPQVPAARARERDEGLIAAWLRQDWPRIKGGLAEAEEPSPSSTRQDTPSGRASARPGPRAAIRPSSGE